MRGEKTTRFIGAAVALVAACLFARYFLIGAPYTSNGLVLAYEFGFLIMNLFALFTMLRSRARGYSWIWFVIGAGLQLWYLLFHMYPPNKIYEEGGCGGAECLYDAWFSIDSVALATLALTVTFGKTRVLRMSQIIAMVIGVAAIILVFIYQPYSDNSGWGLIFHSVFRRMPPVGDEGSISGPLWRTMMIELFLILVYLTAAVIAFREESVSPKKIAIPQILWPMPFIALPWLYFTTFISPNLYDFPSDCTPLLLMCIPLVLVIILVILPKDGNAYRRVSLITIGAEIFFLITLLTVGIVLLMISAIVSGYSDWMQALAYNSLLAIVLVMFPKGSGIYQRIAFWIGFIFEIVLTCQYSSLVMDLALMFSLAWATLALTLVLGWNGKIRRKKDSLMAASGSEPG